MKFIGSLFLLLLLTACQVIPKTENMTTQNEPLIISDSVDDEINVVEEEGLAHLVDDVAVVTEEPESGSDSVSVAPLSVVSYKNIWLKLAEGFSFDVPNNSRIAKQRDYYLKHPKYLQQVSKRAEPFLYLIVEQIEAQNLPLELALLPVVESTFDPFAYSPSNASGLWQFMPVTGKRFGLKQDWWYDGRRDIYASTAAALNYMQLLHKFMGGDWLHAFAAYNSGEGRVLNAVRKNKSRNKEYDFWNLSLPQETENYVPKLLALVDILRNHKKYNIELPIIPNKQVLTYVDTGSQLDLAYAAKLAELSVAEIQLLNPAFNHWATSPEGPHKLLIPTRIATQFKEQLANSAKDSHVRWARYKVRSGDSLSVIAQKNATTSDVLKQINDLDNSFIRVGQPLLIPIASGLQQGSLYAQAQRFQNSPVADNKSKRKVQYTIVEGDTLWDISRRYNVTSQEIAKWNKMNTRQTLRLGQKLTLWKDAPVAQKSQIAQRVIYEVRPGDSLGVIADKFNVKTAELLAWNKLSKNQYIKPGQKLNVYSSTVQSKKQALSSINYTVRSGDSLSVIAQQFNVKTSDLKRWNLLNGKEPIKPGQKLTVYRTTAQADKQVVASVPYQVRSGDSLSVIADKFNIDTAALRRWNQLSSTEYIQPGQQLTIHSSTSAPSRETATDSVIYTVRSGDSLSVIAAKFNVKTADLKHWNKLKDKEYITKGQKLTVYTAIAAQDEQADHIAYTVRAGDSLSVIANTFKVTTQDLKRWNKLNEHDVIKTGQELTVYNNKSDPNMSSIDKVTYKVRSGDSLGIIADKFNVKTTDLVRWNELSGHKYIKPGQTLILYVEQYDLRG